MVVIAWPLLHSTTWHSCASRVQNLWHRNLNSSRSALVAAWHLGGGGHTGDSYNCSSSNSNGDMRGCIIEVAQCDGDV